MAGINIYPQFGVFTQIAICGRNLVNKRVSTTADYQHNPIYDSHNQVKSGKDGYGGTARSNYLIDGNNMERQTTEM
jgi:hypothetical protein